MILFGLSMDYHVFILSRIREAYDEGMTTQAAVAHGIKTTAGVVTSAAIVMVGGVLDLRRPAGDDLQAVRGRARGRDPDRRDLIRAILLPASMSLLGRWNWYLPGWLEWLPHLEHGHYEPDEDDEPDKPDEASLPVAELSTPSRSPGREHEMSDTARPPDTGQEHDLAAPDPRRGACSSWHRRWCSPDSPSCIRNRTTTRRP